MRTARLPVAAARAHGQLRTAQYLAIVFQRMRRIQEVTGPARCLNIGKGQPLVIHREPLLKAQEISRNGGKPYIPNLLERTRHTIPQQGLNYKERGKNVHGAFGVNKNHLQTIKSKTILLIDDVFTSGATLNECARVMKKAKAAAVNVLTVARVTREEF